MLTKEEFVKYLQFIQDKQQKEQDLCNALEACTDGCYCDALIYTEYETVVLELLAKSFGDNDYIYEDILFFVCDLEFGKNYKPGCYVIDGEDHDLSTPEKLYDYLIKQYN